MWNIGLIGEMDSMDHQSDSAESEVQKDILYTMDPNSLRRASSCVISQCHQNIEFYVEMFV